MQKNIIRDRICFDISEGVTFDFLNKKYLEKVNYINSKFEQVSNIKIECESGYYNDDEDYYESIIVAFDRLETDEEFEDRKYRIQLSKENKNKYLREFIDKNKEEAIEYLKELGLI